MRRVHYRCSIRQFLNRPGHHGKAAVIASVEDTSRITKEELRFGNRVPSIYLNISDCSNEVTLQFDLRTRDQQANSLYKLKALVGALTTFQSALEAEIALVRKRGVVADDLL